jgi:hypothetical protein
MTAAQPSEAASGRPEIRLSRVARYQVEQVGGAAFLDRLAAEIRARRHTRQNPESGRFVSRIEDYDVVWEPSADAVNVVAVFARESV